MMLSYIGLPYKSRGRTPSGIDCYGILQLFYKHEFDIELSDDGFIYADASISDQVEKDLKFEESKPEWHDGDGSKIGDVLLFNVKGFVSHVGIIIDPDRKLFLHSFPGRDSCIESMDAISWNKRLVGIKRHVSNR